MMVDVGARPGTTASGGLARRDEIALAVFGTWMATGLYLDGWAHIHNKPETFFTPWHLVLYSGFGAAVAYFMTDRWRRGVNDVSSGTDPIALVGLVVFFAGAAGDFVWHSIFGIEVDLEALLSPTHLSLLGGGVAMVSAPLRSAWARPGERSPTLRRFWPTLASVTLATAVASFFLMYLSAFGLEEGLFAGDGDLAFFSQAHGIASVLITNALLLVPTLLILRRWRPPAGSFAVLYTAIALSRVGIDGLEWSLLVVPGLAGGMVADLVVGRAFSARRTARLIGVAVPLVMWSLWFAALAARGWVHWPAELISGTVVLAVFEGIVLSVMAFPMAMPGVDEAAR